MRVAVIELQAWVDLAISRTGLADCWGHRGLFFFPHSVSDFQVGRIYWDRG